MTSIRFSCNAFAFGTYAQTIIRWLPTLLARDHAEAGYCRKAMEETFALKCGVNTTTL